MTAVADLPALPIAQLLRQHSLTPKKSLGQNFLVDDSILRRIVAGAEVEAADVVLEIGAGLGSLTRHLALAAGRVIAVELDQHLLPILREVLAGFNNVDLVHGDMLKLDPASLVGDGDYLVIANIPYYITSALIRHLLEASQPPRRLVFTMQEEVAERICARDGRHSLLSLSVQVYGTAHKLLRIPAGAFYPSPAVDSCSLRVDLMEKPLITPGQSEAFFRLAKAGFSQKRKNLRNSLAGGLGWEKEAAEALLRGAGIATERRAETLSLAEWQQLTVCYLASLPG